MNPLYSWNLETNSLGGFFCLFVCFYVGAQSLLSLPALLMWNHGTQVKVILNNTNRNALLIDTDAKSSLGLSAKRHQWFF